VLFRSASLTSKGTPVCRFGSHEFNGYFYTLCGPTTDSNGTITDVTSKWNGSAWATATPGSASRAGPGVFTQGGLLHVMSGYNSTNHDTFNTSDTRAAATVSAGNSTTAASSITSAGGHYTDGTTTNCYQWNGSWLSAVTTPYTFQGTLVQSTANGYNTSTGVAYSNGGSTAGAAIGTSAAFNGTAWSSSVSSTNSRSGCQGGVI